MTKLCECTILFYRTGLTNGWARFHRKIHEWNASADIVSCFGGDGEKYEFYTSELLLRCPREAFGLAVKIEEDNETSHLWRFLKLVEPIELRQ